ncbi:MerR family transcriptional regulator [Thalassolituus sp. LLYu03]|uniref:MerR family transcriptional regulator n=1 Tax=Thalassolituus sp. LLYu03 TaxID=3421656 RepID=UPI003D2837E5
MSQPNKLSLDEVSEILAMKAVTIKRYVKEGLLDGDNENGQLVFDPEKVARFKAIQEKLR